MKKRVIIFEDDEAYVGENGIYTKMLTTYRQSEFEYEYITGVEAWVERMRQNPELSDVVLFVFDYNIIGGNTERIVRELKESLPSVKMIANSGTDNHILVNLGCTANPGSVKNLREIKKIIDEVVPVSFTSELARVK